MTQFARMTSLHRNKEAGMTLIEVLIALFVFAISALAIAAMTFMSIRGNAMTNQMSQATFLAQDKMEELLALRTTSDLLDMYPAPDNTETVGSYKRTWVRSAGPTASSFWMTVTIGWTDRNGDHQVVVRSLWRGI